MHRRLLIAALALVFATAQLSAQRGGGHASGGGHAGGGFSAHGGFGGHSFGGGHFGGSHIGGGHAFSGTRSRRSFAAHSVGRGSLHSRSSPGRRYSNHSWHIGTYPYGNNCWGYGCGWGYPYLGGGIDPYWWWDSDSSSDSDYDSGPQYDNGIANEVSPPWRAPESGDQNAYAHPAPQQRQAERTDASPATVLVFRDQHRQEVQNYAIVGQALWVFTPQRMQKIRLSDLDLAATAEENDEHGVTFRLPGTGGGQ